MYRNKVWLIALVSFVFADVWWLRLSASQRTGPDEVLHFKTKIISVRPHDPEAFTQGLLFHMGALYESTGLKGASSLRMLDPDTGKTLRKIDLPENLFGEGLTLVDNRLIQLTWEDRTALLYDLQSFDRTGEFSYEGEGWGLCFDGKHLIMSNGTETLTLRDPKTFQPKKEIHVTLAGQPVRNLNECEYVDGIVYSNIWPTDTIAGIDLNSGRVVSLIHAEGLLSKEERSRTDVLNGIAYHPQKRTFFLTGKLWPKLFEVIPVPRKESGSAS